MPGTRSWPSLVGRRSECDSLRGLLAAAKAGRSQVLVLRGEAGIGKTALLEFLLGRATGCQVGRAAGIESEMELAFAGLHQLCSPYLDRVDTLPAPQAEALATAGAFGCFGRAGSTMDRRSALWAAGVVATVRPEHLPGTAVGLDAPALPAGLTETRDRDGAFPRLTAGQLALLEGAGQRLVRRTGEVLFAEGDPGYAFFVVLSGQVAVVDDWGRVGQHVVSVHGAGRFLGELNLFTASVVTLTAVVSETAEVLEVDGAEAG